jgi:hypothetical protein
MKGHTVSHCWASVSGHSYGQNGSYPVRLEEATSALGGGSRRITRNRKLEPFVRLPSIRSVPG